MKINMSYFKYLINPLSRPKHVDILEEYIYEVNRSIIESTINLEEAKAAASIAEIKLQKNKDILTALTNLKLMG